MSLFLFIAFLIFMFIGVPILLPCLIVMLTSRENTDTAFEGSNSDSNKPPTPSSQQYLYPPDSAPESSPKNVATNSIRAKFSIESKADENPLKAKWLPVFLVIVALCVPPGAGITTFMVGVVAFGFAAFASIATFGYGGFFEFSAKIIHLGFDIFVWGLWSDVLILGFLGIYRLIKLLRSL